jgi:hypothetical protein
MKVRCQQPAVTGRVTSRRTASLGPETHANDNDASTTVTPALTSNLPASTPLLVIPIAPSPTHGARRMARSAIRDRGSPLPASRQRATVRTVTAGRVGGPRRSRSHVVHGRTGQQGGFSVPIISMFHGIIIRLYLLDGKQHDLPHIHAKYAES